RITRVDEAWSAGDGLRSFLEKGHHATMAWMAQTFARRQHPQATMTALFASGHIAWGCCRRANV
ncbi:MAG: hypothetical protein AAGJ29_06145, partial [Pseudomonadota bacterium]